MQQMSISIKFLALENHLTFRSFIKLKQNLAKLKVENLIKQLFHSPLLDTRLVSYPTRAHGIIVKYSFEFCV